MSHSAEVYRMFRVFKTLFEMLYDRGYLVKDQDLELTVERFKNDRCLLEGEGDQAQFRLKARSSLWLLHRKPGGDKEGVFVFFPDEPKMGVKPVRQYHDKMIEEKVSRAIVVTQQNPTPFAKQVLRACHAGRAWPGRCSMAGGLDARGSRKRRAGGWGVSSCVDPEQGQPMVSHFRPSPNVCWATKCTTSRRGTFSEMVFRVPVHGP